MTDRFEETARAVATIQGLPEYPFVVIGHPIAGDSDEQLRGKAEGAVAAIVSLMTKRTA
jgi:hypothetical protein